MTEQEKPRGLSYSSFTEYSSCARKWFLRKVRKLTIDSDADPSTYAFDIGKAFHKCLEDTMHDLKGFTFAQCSAACREYNLTDVEDVALVYAMLSKYKKLHEKTGLKVVACEVCVDVPGFYGFVDAVIYEEGVGLWICDMKTAATFQKSTLQTVTSHPQLNLYARHFDIIAYTVGLKSTPFAGVRLRTTTKSKLGMKPGEDVGEYVVRLARGIKSTDIVVPAELLKNMSTVYAAHQRVNEIASTATLDDEHKFPPNFGNCFSYFKPCEHYSKCHGYLISEAPNVQMWEV